MDERSLFDLGLWLQRKWVAMEDKRKRAMEVLEQVLGDGITVDQLELEWANQIKEQTLPLKRQSDSLANKAIEEIMILAKNLDQYKKELKSVEDMLETGVYEDNMDQYGAETILEELTTKISKAQRVIEGKKTKLSVDGRLNLKKLLDNEFLRTRMNALALKQRIRDRLRQRKFEIENLEQAYRTTINHSKLESHANQQIKKKEPGIQTLARNYNKLCEDLKRLIQQKKAPRGAVVPLQINLQSLFQLDVDDSIWEDIGLTGENDDGQAVPGWLGDEEIRKGIRALLEFRRCEEEKRRLITERLSMQQWFKEEWTVLMTAFDWSSEDQDVVFQLTARKKELLRLCVTWLFYITVVPSTADETWGPSFEELAEARLMEKTANVIDIAERDSADMEIDVGITEDERIEDDLLSWDSMDDLDGEAELLDNMELDIMETDM